MQNRHDINVFQNRTLAFVNELLALDSAVFFLLEQGHQHRCTAVLNSALAMDKQYTTTYAALDPLNPTRFHYRDDAVVTIDTCIAPHLLKQSVYYHGFMRPNNHRYVADMFFRDKGQVIAVLSLLRQESHGDFTTAELVLLRKLQPFLEYSLNTIHLPKRYSQRRDFIDRYGFTPRELDVVELLRLGCSNKTIAMSLSLGISTVKTHLHHLFKKTNVQSRSELIALLAEASSQSGER